MAAFDLQEQLLSRPSLGFTTEATLLRVLRERFVGVGGHYIPHIHDSGVQPLDADIVVMASGTFSPARTALGKELEAKYLGFKVYRGISLNSSAQIPFQTWGPGGRFASVPFQG
jgi:hypothetical protein